MKSKFNFEEVTDRVKKALKIKTDLELAEKINMKPAAFNRRKKAQSLPYEELLELADLQKLDFNWVLTGEGEMLKGELPPTSAEISPRIAKMAELLDGLNEDQQREVFAAVAEKKRLNNLEATIAELLKRTA